MDDFTRLAQALQGGALPTPGWLAQILFRADQNPGRALKAWDMPSLEDVYWKLLDCPLGDEHLAEVVFATAGSTAPWGFDISMAALGHPGAGPSARRAFFNEFYHRFDSFPAARAVFVAYELTVARVRRARYLAVSDVSWMLTALVGETLEVLEAFEALALDSFADDPHSDAGSVLAKALDLAQRL